MNSKLSVRFLFHSQPDLAFEVFFSKPEESLRMNSTICELNCSAINGHIPYLYEVDSVVADLIKNETINTTIYPIFAERKRISIVEDYRKFTFHISATYNFQTRTWKSGGLRIQKNQWAETGPSEANFPILDDRLLLSRNDWSNGDHFGAVYCGDNLGENEYKVRRIYHGPGPDFPGKFLRWPKLILKVYSDEAVFIK